MDGGRARWWDVYPAAATRRHRRPASGHACLLIATRADKSRGETAKAQAASAREGDPPAAVTQGWERAATRGLGPGTGHAMECGLVPYVCSVTTVLQRSECLRLCSVNLTELRGISTGRVFSNPLQPAHVPWPPSHTLFFYFVFSPQ